MDRADGRDIEVRAIPSNDFGEMAGSALKHYREGLERVRHAEEFDRKMKDLLRTADRRYVDIGHAFDDVNRTRREKNPNGIHVHAPKDAYNNRLFDLVAVWWNQKDASSTEMLALRNKSNYGRIGADGIRTSGVCNGGHFREYRQLNSDTPENIEQMLVPVLETALTVKPALPAVAGKTLAYGNKEVYLAAEAWCLNLLKTREVMQSVQDGRVLGNRNRAGNNAVAVAA